MAHRGHIGKTLLVAELAALCLLLPAPMEAQTAVSLSNGFSTAASSMTTNMALGATWGGGQTPTNGNNAFIVFTNKNSGVNLTLTNAASNVFVADSLTITNMSRGNLAVTFSGAAFLTSGVAQVNFNGAGTTQAGTTALTFSNSVTFGAMNFIGNSGGGASETATLTLAVGIPTGNSLLFNGQGSENNFLVISGTLGLTGTLTATNINSTSAGTISGNSTVGNVMINNAADNRFTVTRSTISITSAVASVAGGFTLANNATIALSGGGGLIISNVAPVLNGTLMSPTKPSPANELVQQRNGGVGGRLHRRQQSYQRQRRYSFGLRQSFQRRCQSGDDLGDQQHARLRQQYRPGRDSNDWQR